MSDSEVLEALNKIVEILKEIKSDNSSTIIGIIQIVLAVAACILAWFIPKRIMWEQTYSTLAAEYRSYDFAVAIQSVIEFFVITCKSNYENIPSEYRKRFIKDMYGEEYESYSYLDDEALLEKLRKDKTLKIVPANRKKVLNYHKRLLTQYFHDLSLCAKSPFIGKKRVQRDFTKSEAKIMKILFLMNKAVDESPLLYKDISSDFRMPRPMSGSGMNKDLTYLYSILVKSGRFMNVK